MTIDNRELSDEAKAEIAAAVHIVAEDKFYKRLMDSNGPKIPVDEKASGEPPKPLPNDPAIPQDADPASPQSPPAKDIPESVPPKKKAGLYWGDETYDLLK